MGFTYKQGVPDEKKDSKINLETKFKSVIGGNTHEGTIKQDGSFNFEFKTDYLGVKILFYSNIKLYFRDSAMFQDSILF